MLTKRDLLRLSAGGALAPVLPLSARAQNAPRPGLFGAIDIAQNGVAYGLPIVMNYAVMYKFAIDKNSGQYKAPFNEINHARETATYKDTAVVTPNADTPYSTVWMDLRAEPMVLTVPAVDPKRYYSVQLVDSSTYNYGYIGSRTTGSDGGDYLVVGPDWRGETPAGIKKVFKSSSQHSLAIFRTQLFNAADIDNVHKVQDGYKARPLSAFLNQPAPSPAPAIDFPKIDDETAKTKFFEYLAFMLQFMPPMQNEDAVRANLAKIGVVAGKPFSLDSLRLDDRMQILVGMRMASRRIDDVLNLAGTNVNGWRLGLGGGDAGYFNGDWLKRAAVAQGGIYANDALEAAYPFARNDARGRPLDGRSKYTLTLPANGLPPVNAFWSVTIYDGKTQLLVQNPIDRYLINSSMLPDLKKNPDGSITIYVQHASPGPDKESNWLPAPEGPIYVVMRLYWPKTSQPSILPLGSGSWKPPGLTRVR
jgi:hypothetical protein